MKSLTMTDRKSMEASLRRSRRDDKQKTDTGRHCRHKKFFSNKIKHIDETAIVSTCICSLAQVLGLSCPHRKSGETRHGLLVMCEENQMNRWVTWVILGICVLSIAIPFLFSRQGPYGGRSVIWYNKHPVETKKELKWCREKTSRSADGSCRYARNGEMAMLLDD